VRRALPLLLAAALFPARASARPLRPRFEPTDLELEQSGVIDVDVQLGMSQGADGARTILPDFEIDVGLLDNFEHNLDGAFAVERAANGQISTYDNLWLAAKVGLLDVRNPLTGSAWALGLQFGPKLPIGRGFDGIGFESLLLIGFTRRRVHTVLNVGGFADADTPAGRPLGVQAGLDFSLDLDESGQVSFDAQLGGVYFVSADPAQLLFSGGFTWAASEQLDVSVAGLVGFLPGSDRFGVLVGFSPKFRVFKR
jgi:hypothetical protein